MPRPLQIVPGITIPANELSFATSRASGPGGQATNKVNTRVQLSFDIAHSTVITGELRDRALERLSSRLRKGVITVAASKRSSQAQNLEAAERNLVRLLQLAIAEPGPERQKTKPSRAATARRLDDKARQSRKKQDRSSLGD